MLEEAVCRLVNAVTGKMTVQMDLMRSVVYMHRKRHFLSTITCFLQNVATFQVLLEGIVHSKMKITIIYSPT